MLAVHSLVSILSVTFCDKCVAIGLGWTASPRPPSSITSTAISPWCFALVQSAQMSLYADNGVSVTFPLVPVPNVRKTVRFWHLLFAVTG